MAPGQIAKVVLYVEFNSPAPNNMAFLSPSVLDLSSLGAGGGSGAVVFPDQLCSEQFAAAAACGRLCGARHSST